MSFAYGENRTASAANAQDKVWGEQSPYLTGMYGQAESLAGRTPDQSVAGFNPMQQVGQGMAANYAVGQGTGIANQTAGALNFGLNAANVNQNPYLQQAMQSSIRPLTQAYQENALSGITDQAVASGGYGGSRQGIAEGIAARGYLDSVGDVVSGMGNQAYGQGLNTMMQAVGQAPNVQNMGLFGSNVMQGIGGQYQGLEQQRMDAPWTNLQRQQQITGAPVTLGESQSRSKGKAWNVSGSMGGT